MLWWSPRRSLLYARADNDTRLLHLLSLWITSTITSLPSQPLESKDVKAEMVRHSPTKQREKKKVGEGAPAAETFSPVIHDKLQITHFSAQYLKFWVCQCANCLHTDKSNEFKKLKMAQTFALHLPKEADWYKCAKTHKHPLSSWIGNTHRYTHNLKVLKDDSKVVIEQGRGRQQSAKLWVSRLNEHSLIKTKTEKTLNSIKTLAARTIWRKWLIKHQWTLLYS